MEYNRTDINRTSHGGTLQLNSIFQYGKYAGFKVSTIARSDPRYIKWIHRNCQRVSKVVWEEAEAMYEETTTPEDREIDDMSDNMNELEAKKNQLLMMIREDYQLVGVKFDVRYPALEEDAEAKAYTYKYPKDMDIEVGDVVVLPVNRGIGMEIKTATVTEKLDIDQVLTDRAGHKFKWIVGRVSFEMYDKEEAMDNSIVTGIMKAQRKQVLAQAKQELVELLGGSEVAKLRGGEE